MMKYLSYTLSPLAIALLGVLLSPLSYSQNTLLLNNANTFFEQNVQQTQLLEKETAQPETKLHTPNHNSLDSIEQQLNHAMLTRDWKALPNLLVKYKNKAPHYDKTLYLYALGAFYRSQDRHAEAIQAYQEILQSHPDLAYPRFDLAIMLFENKQYRQAKQQFLLAKEHLQLEMQSIVDMYLQSIQKRQAWQPSVDVQYEQTDNVNNASRSETINVNGLLFTRDEASLPQSAEGVRYGLGVDKLHNIHNNHNVKFSANYNAVNYWDNPDYNEQSYRLDLGYLYQNNLKSWEIVPFATYHRLGGEDYNQQYGVTSQYRQRLDENWQWSMSAMYLQKHYDDERIAKRYDGQSYQLATQVYWQPHTDWLLWSGVDSHFDQLKDSSESSQRNGISVGGVWSRAGFGVRMNMRYAQRRFAEEHYLYAQKRQDKEYHYVTAFWHNKIQWKGLMPKLNYRYVKIDSNLADLYSRSSGEWYMSIDKTF